MRASRPAAAPVALAHVTAARPASGRHDATRACCRHSEALARTVSRRSMRLPALAIVATSLRARARVCTRVRTSRGTGVRACACACACAYKPVVQRLDGSRRRRLKIDVDGRRTSSYIVGDASIVHGTAFAPRRRGNNGDASGLCACVCIARVTLLHLARAPTHTRRSTTRPGVRRARAAQVPPRGQRERESGEPEETHASVGQYAPSVTCAVAARYRSPPPPPPRDSHDNARPAPHPYTNSPTRALLPPRFVAPLPLPPPPPQPRRSHQPSRARVPSAPHRQPASRPAGTTSSCSRRQSYHAGPLSWCAGHAP